MTFFDWLVLSVVIGYLGSVIMRSEPDRSAAVSIAAGILGALIAGWLLAPLLGGSPDRGFFGATVAGPLLGAVVLIGMVNLLRYRRIR
jgi:uncharacterized membrane protein YeaQ/YmgE (transglycosylase-associated protein family)